MFRNFKVLLIAFAVLVLAASSYAFAAAITGIPDSKAGTGSGTVTGYVVSNVAYTFNTSDPTLLDQVDFTLDATATSVKIQVNTVAGDWYTCTNVLTDWTCITTSPQATTATMDTLTIVASDH
ncbi:MAG: hypothetical protein IPP66_22350 [Anaerolineales bacterium]|nr:hypothetical protein [Anaerolineales bacterium]